MRLRTAALLVLFLAACGKKGDPTPPVPIIPKSTTDLSVAQRGPNVILSWSYPSLTTAGKSLERIDAIAVYRYREVLPGTLAGRDPRQLAPGEGDPGHPPEVELFERVPAVTGAQFGKLANRIDRIRGADLPRFVAGSRINYTDDPPVRAEDGLPVRYTYAVVTLGDEARSEFSNLVSIVPLLVPVPPSGLAASAPGAEVQLRWQPPSASIAGGGSPTLIGYNVYRFPPAGEIVELGTPLNPAPLADPAFTDVPPYGSYRYAVTAVASAGPPQIQSEPTPTVLVEFRDRVAPPPPASVVPLVEEGAVRLLWDPVPAADLAGYRVYRGAQRAQLTTEPILEVNFRDPSPVRGSSYTYWVTSVDRNGNESAATESAPVFVPR